jgi:HD-GYP domain-containing protein (c-di-GMP phosphodiesterase class II)/DNA-binding CsgD family transcriptional regulator
MRLADELEISHTDRTDLYYASLIKEVGCVCGASQLASRIDGDEQNALADMYTLNPESPRDMIAWMSRHVAVGQALPNRAKRMLDFLIHGKELEKQGAAEECEMARLVAARLGMTAGVQGAVAACLERWDGKGAPTGLKGEAIPPVARLLNFASTIEIFHRVEGEEAAREVAARRRGKAFDPAIVDAFLAMSRRSDIWERLKAESLWDAVLQMDPDPEARSAGETQLEAFAIACADLVDAKDPAGAGRSRRVAELSAAVARRLGVSEPELTMTRRAALIHDLGLMAVPSHVIARQRSTLSDAEQEKLRLHPYHAERILSRVGALEPLAIVVGSHHERIDGKGYYRGLAGRQIPLAARVIAVADAYDDLIRAAGDGRVSDQSRAADDAIRALEADPGAYDVDALQALREELGAGAGRPPRREWPGGLTEREVQVLRLLVTGLNRKEIAAKLVVSEATARHHLEHIYAKLGVSSRAGAVMFALEQRLV